MAIELQKKKMLKTEVANETMKKNETVSKT